MFCFFMDNAYYFSVEKNSRIFYDGQEKDSVYTSLKYFTRLPLEISLSVLSLINSLQVNLYIIVLKFS